MLQGRPQTAMIARLRVPSSRRRVLPVLAAVAGAAVSLASLAASSLPGAALGAAASADTWRVPVLMYHRVDAQLVAHDPITVGLTVMTPVFEAQLSLLRNAGYQAMSLDDLWAGLVRHAPVPTRRVVLTFDDGYADSYTVVFPLLRRYGFVGTFFVVTSSVGTKDHLTVAQIRKMAQAGMEIESHGQHHLDFTQFSLPTARTELSRSREIISGWTGRPVNFFAYPAGRYSPALERLLGSLGYHGALTEIPGFVTPRSAPYTLERVRVSHDDTLRTFALKLSLPPP